MADNYYLIINETHGVVIGAMQDRTFIYSKDIIMSEILANIVAEIPIATDTFVKLNTHDVNDNTKFSFLPVENGSLAGIWNKYPSMFAEYKLERFIKTANTKPA